MNVPIIIRPKRWRVPVLRHQLETDYPLKGEDMTEDTTVSERFWEGLAVGIAVMVIVACLFGCKYIPPVDAWKMAAAEATKEWRQ